MTVEDPETVKSLPFAVVIDTVRYTMRHPKNNQKGYFQAERLAATSILHSRVASNQMNRKESRPRTTMTRQKVDRRGSLESTEEPDARIKEVFETRGNV